jgi:hypothetical protein
VIGAMVVIFIGIMLLLNTMKVLPWEMWDDVRQFWPILVILFGLKMMVGDSHLARVLMGGLTFVVLAFVVLQLMVKYQVDVTKIWVVIKQNLVQLQIDRVRWG